MKRVLLFLWLYGYAEYQWFRNRKQSIPRGRHGQKLFLFFDPNHPERRHGVVAFLLPEGTEIEAFKDDLFGPFGYTSQIDWHGRHLYGRDTWGFVQKDQISANPILKQLQKSYPHHIILLAGVRTIFGKHIWPFTPSRFILVLK